MITCIGAILTTLGGTILVGIPFVLANIFWPVYILIVFIVLWFLALVLRKNWVNPPGLLVIFGLIGLGLMFEGSPLILFCGAFLYIIGWDLTEFHFRVQAVRNDAYHRVLVNYHLLYLSLLLLTSGVLLLFAVIIKFHIPFGWIIIFTLTAALGLRKIITSLLMKEKE